jgi:vacuolar-type H+-ATPase subunit H
MDLDTLRFGNFTSLGTAIDDWTRVVGNLETLEKNAREGLKGLADKANWAGVNATVSREFITKTAGEFTDAHTEASTIRNILKDTHEELVSYHEQLNEAISRGLKKNLTVMDTGNGSFTVTMNIHPDRAAKGTTVPDHSEQDVTELRDDVQRILGRATHSDETASEALRAIVEQAEYGFSSASYGDRDSATKALEDAEKYANLIKNKGDSMSPQEFDELNRNLAGYKNDPLFQEKFATTLGPKGTLDFWADLSDPSDGGDLQRARLDQLGEFQKNLSLTLAGATQSDYPPCGTGRTTWSTG